MIRKISEKLTQCFVNRKIIKEADSNIYIYGCELIIASMLCKSITLLIGLALGKFGETIFFLVIFFLIRIFAGGYHASTHLACITLFNVVFFAVMIITNFLVQQEFYLFLYAGMVISGIIIFVYAPVEDNNKPLDQEERMQYRKIARTRTLEIVIGTLLLLVLFPQMVQLFSYSAIAVCEVSVLLIIGKNKVNNSLDCKKLLQKKQLDI